MVIDKVYKFGKCVINQTGRSKRENNLEDLFPLFLFLTVPYEPYNLEKKMTLEKRKSLTCL